MTSKSPSDSSVSVISDESIFNEISHAATKLSHWVWPEMRNNARLNIHVFLAESLSEIAAIKRAIIFALFIAGISARLSAKEDMMDS